MVFKGFIYNGKKNAPKTQNCPMPLLSVRGVFCDIKKKNGGKSSPQVLVRKPFGRVECGIHTMCVQRKVKGKTMNYRVGIKIPEDEPDWF